MEGIAAINVKNREDALKYAYAFMKSEKLNIKECAFLNPHPKKFDEIHIMPTDLYSAT